MDRNTGLEYWNDLFSLNLVDIAYLQWGNSDMKSSIACKERIGYNCAGEGSCMFKRVAEIGSLSQCNQLIMSS